MKMNKKGVIEQLQNLVAPLVAIAIILIVGLLIIAEGKTQVVDKTGVSVTKNTTATFTGGLNNTAIYLDGNCMTLGCTTVVNDTGVVGDALSTDCYTCSSSTITIVNHTDGCGVHTNTTPIFNVTYTCKQRSVAFNATGTIQNATQDIPGWLPIIVITIIGALLIGLVTRFRRQ